MAKSLPRKIVYGDRENPRVQTVQPLVDYFAAVDRGDKQLPVATPAPQPAAQEG